MITYRYINGSTKSLIGINSNGDWLCKAHTKTDLLILRSTLEHEYCHYYRQQQGFDTDYNNVWYIKMREEFSCALTIFDYEKENLVI